jgi:hypothetical protein
VQAVETKRAIVPPVAPLASPAPAAEGGKPAPVGSGARPIGAGDAGDVPNLKAVEPSELKAAFLGEIRKAKKFFYGTVVAQAQRIEFEADRVVFVFGPQHRALRVQLEQNRPWLEAAATQLAGRRMSVTAAEGTMASLPASTKPLGAGQPAPPGRAAAADKPASAAESPANHQQSLKDRALSDTGVQTMLDVFAAEIKDIEEM